MHHPIVVNDYIASPHNTLFFQFCCVLVLCTLAPVLLDVGQGHGAVIEHHSRDHVRDGEEHVDGGQAPASDGHGHPDVPGLLHLVVHGHVPGVAQRVVAAGLGHVLLKLGLAFLNNIKIYYLE